MEGLKASVVTLLVFALLALFSSVYTIKEGQEGFIIKLGKLETSSETGKAVIKKPGIHFKIPFIENIRLFDVRLHTFEPRPARIVTKRQKAVIVDYFLKWRIADPSLYYTRTTNRISEAQKLMEQQLNDKLRAEFGRRTISEVVSDDRLVIMKSLQEQANIAATYLGLSIIDVRIKRIDLPPEVSISVFERMSSKRQTVANEHLAAGRARAEAIRTKAQAAATVTKAAANDTAAQIRAKGDQEAAKIYADAYKKNPEFYEFYRSIYAYRETFNNKNDIIVLQPKGQFFKYFADASSSHHAKS